MEIIALRSPGLPSNELRQATAEVGVTLTVVTSLEEAQRRGLTTALVVVDGVGETAELLNDLKALGRGLERVFWIGFEVPSVQLPGLQLISPLDAAAELVVALSGDKPPADQQTMMPISLVPDAAEEIVGDWQMAVEQPAPPLDRPPPPTVAPMIMRFDQDDADEHDVVIEAEVLPARPTLRLGAWLKPAALVVGLTALTLYFVDQHFQTAVQIALPAPVENMPVYPDRGLRLDEKPAAVVPVAVPPPPPVEVIAKAEPTSKKQKQAKTVSSFDSTQLKKCIRRLGKKGRMRVGKKAKLRVSMRLGVMGDGRIAAASVIKVRIGKRRYRSKRFSACIEGRVVGQQLALRPEKQPLFIRRIFTIKP
jgi:hypothetical protein